MQFFDYEEIKKRGDCVRYCTEVLGLTPQGKSGKDAKFNNPWRPGSDSGAFSVCRETYYDHVSGETGSILDLCANARHGGQMMAAQAELGEWLGLEPKQKVKKKKRIVATYDYTDAAGELVFQVVRWEPKHFSQRRPNPDSIGIDGDEWLWNIEGVPDLLYRLPAIAKKSRVIIVGGEKDADALAALGLPATTNPGGEGHWKPAHAEFLRGKVVAVIPDKDSVGAKHAQAVVATLKDVAESVRVVRLPDIEGRTIKDVSDWIEAGATKQDITDLIKASTGATTTPAQVLPTLEAQPNEIARAKEANKTPFSNYTILRETDDEGRAKKPVRVPRKMNDMVEDLFTRLLGFPRRLGSSLFDHDRDTDKIRTISNAAALIGWIGEKTKHPVRWTRSTEGAVTYEQFYESVLAQAREYDLASGTPTWPMRNDVYYTCGDLPAPDPEYNKFLELTSFFCPAEWGDELMLRAFWASPLYFIPRVDRPLWVIDAESGQGTGKTKLVEFLAYLYGGEEQDTGTPIMVDADQLANETQAERIHRRLLSQSGRRKRILLLDNVDKKFRSQVLSTLVTQSSISGMAPYGRGEESRAMDLTIALTSNNAKLDDDLVDRAFYITLKKPDKPMKNWSQAVSKFIRENRLQIIADIIGILERGADFDVDPRSRFKDWERDVLCPMMGCFDFYSDVIKHNLNRQVESSSDAEDGSAIWDVVLDRLELLGITPDGRKPIFITTHALTMWVRTAMPGLAHSDANAMRIIKGIVKRGHAGDLTDSKTPFPSRGRLRRNGCWVNAAARTADAPVHYIGIGSDGGLKTEVIQ